MVLEVEFQALCGVGSAFTAKIFHCCHKLTRVELFAAGLLIFHTMLSNSLASYTVTYIL